jgi:hypothetical protein
VSFTYGCYASINGGYLQRWTSFLWLRKGGKVKADRIWCCGKRGYMVRLAPASEMSPVSCVTPSGRFRDWCFGFHINSDLDPARICSSTTIFLTLEVSVVAHIASKISLSQEENPLATVHTVLLTIGKCQAANCTPKAMYVR